MGITNVRDLIIRHEGRVNKLYQDSLGYWTIGVGHLIDPRLGATLPWELVDRLFDIDLARHSEELRAKLPWVAELDEVRAAVVTDMYFNLGPKLLEFRNTLAAVEEGRWDDAAAGMMQSKWARQVGPRAARLAKMMESGEWPSG